jgi:short-subunit dehydrogenase
MDNQNPLILVAVGVGALLVVLWVVGWWRERQYNLTGKTVLLTGGSRGLGLVMARQLIQQGARLAICARDAAELERARNELEQQGGQVLALPCDVTDRSQVEQMVQQVGDRFGQIDILINNAGTDLIGPMDVLTMEDYDDLMKLHFWAPLYTSYAVFPEMRQRQAGRIVNISSIGGKVVSPHMLAYCASKFALTGLSEGMRAELAKEGIAVTTVCPGFIRTGVIDHAIFKGQHRKEYTWFSIADSLPLLSTSAENVARQTIAALRRGDAELIVPFWTQISAKLFALFPGLNSTLLGWANRLLPEAGGIGSERAFGKDSHSSLSPSWLTSLSDKAARENNEIATENADSAGADQPVETERQHRQVEAQRVVIGETDSFGITEGTPSPESAIVEDDQ